MTSIALTLPPLAVIGDVFCYSSYAVTFTKKMSDELNTITIINTSHQPNPAPLYRDICDIDCTRRVIQPAIE